MRKDGRDEATAIETPTLGRRVVPNKLKPVTAPESPGQRRPPVRAISEVPGLTDSEKRSIMSDNAAAMFGR